MTILQWTILGGAGVGLLMLSATIQGLIGSAKNRTPPVAQYLSIFGTFLGCGLIVVGFLEALCRTLLPLAWCQGLEIGFRWIAAGAAAFLLGLEIIRVTGIKRHKEMRINSRFVFVDIGPHISLLEGVTPQIIRITRGERNLVLPNLLKKAAPNAARNHIVCLDGTWNETTVATNVHRLFKLLDDTAEDQIARYYTGVGVFERVGTALDFLEVPIGLGPLSAITGMGERLIRHQAYLDLVATYRPGDKIFLFGFSRGAMCARCLANDIFDWGLPERIQAKFRRSDTKAQRMEQLGAPVRVSQELLWDIAVLGVRPKTINIEMMGLWDTVASIGLPFNKNEPFRKLTIPANVKKVCHLVAADERRLTYSATLIKYDASVEEIWFAGGHSNIGGGFTDKAAHEQNGLSDITLRFMIERASRCGLKFKPEAFQITGDIRGQMQSSRGRNPRRIQVLGVLPPHTDARPRLHKSLVDRAALRSGYRLPVNDYIIEDEQWRNTADTDASKKC